VWLWIAWAGGLSAHEAAPEDREPAFVTYQLSSNEVFLQESVRVTLRFGIESGFMDERMIPRFTRPLDLSVEVVADPATAVSGDGDPDVLELLASSVPAPGSLSFALGGDVAFATPVGTEDREGRTFRVYEHTRRFVATRTGPVVVDAPRIRLSHATRFELDLFGERTPVDRRDLTVEGTSLAFGVKKLPEPTRLTDFSGAVGSFAITASVEPTMLRMGERATLTLTIRGEGALDRFEPPDLSHLAGLHTLGVLDTMGDGARTIRYDLTPTGVALTEIPSIEFTYFDPKDGGSYRRIGTDPLPFAVEADPSASSIADAAIPGGGEPVPDNGWIPFSPKPWVPSHSGFPPATGSYFGFVSAIALPWVVFAFFLPWWRRRQRDREDPLGARERRAAGRFRAAMREGLPVEPAFAEYVAARLRTPEAAAIDPALCDRLVDAGVTEFTAKWTAEHLRELTASRYGGPAVRSERMVTEELVGELERNFRRARRKR